MINWENFNTKQVKDPSYGYVLQNTCIWPGTDCANSSMLLPQ